MHRAQRGTRGARAKIGEAARKIQAADHLLDPSVRAEPPQLRRIEGHRHPDIRPHRYCAEPIELASRSLERLGEEPRDGLRIGISGSTGRAALAQLEHLMHDVGSEIRIGDQTERRRHRALHRSREAAHIPRLEGKADRGDPGIASHRDLGCLRCDKIDRSRR